MNKQRKRGANWTPQMKEAFRSFVAEHASVINSKSNDTKLIVAKSKAWQDVGNKMASLGFVVDIKKMREMWVRMKCLARTEVQAYKRATAATGGGTPPRTPADIHFNVLETDPVDAVEDWAEYDGDADFMLNETLTQMDSPTEKKKSPPDSPIIETPSKANLGKTGDTVLSSLKRKRTSKTQGTQRWDEAVLEARLEQIQEERKFNRTLKELQVRVEEEKLQHNREEWELKKKLYEAQL